eukprot:gene7586-17208_t
MRVRNVYGDGNCQFRAVHRQLRMRGIIPASCSHQHMRARCVQWLGAHRHGHVGDTELFQFVGSEAEFDEFLASMQGNEWGNHMTLMGLASVYQVDIKVWSSLDSWDTPQVFPPFFGANAGNGTITIGHYHEYHYVSVEPAAPHVKDQRESSSGSDAESSSGSDADTSSGSDPDSDPPAGGSAAPAARRSATAPRGNSPKAPAAKTTPPL